MYKVAIIGPESTGKSALAEKLADFYHSVWVPEYARGYIENLNQPYTFDDVMQIAKHQIEEEKAFENQSTHPFVFFDTELIITKVWFEYVYKEVPSFLKERLQKGFFDLYLLCEPDIPWEADSVRENGDNRDFFFNWYQKEIENLNKPFIKIHGLGDDRLQNAITAINQYFKIDNNQANK